MCARRIKGSVYRVRSMNYAWLVEVSEENTMQELAEFCAELTREGAIITSVSHIFHVSTDTPRVAVLNTPEYKKALRELENRDADDFSRSPCDSRPVRKHSDYDPDWCHSPCDSRSHRD